MSLKLLYAFVAIAVVLLAITIFFAWRAFQNPQSTIETPTPPISQTRKPTPTSAPIKPPVQYTPGTFQKDVDKLQNRQPLEGTDIQAKKTMLAAIGNKSGMLFSSANIALHYVAAPDDIEGEILTVDIQAAKKEAQMWLREHGLSQTGICNFPVTFYLNFDVANSLRGTNTQFSPLPDGC